MTVDWCTISGEYVVGPAQVRLESILHSGIMQHAGRVGTERFAFPLAQVLCRPQESMYDDAAVREALDGVGVLGPFLQAAAHADPAVRSQWWSIAKDAIPTAVLFALKSSFVRSGAAPPLSEVD